MTRRLVSALAVALVLSWAGAGWAQRLPCPEFQVNTYTTGSQSPVGVASDAAGNFVVVWADGERGGNGYGRRFSPVGVPLGAEFGLGRPGLIASDAAGNFVVVSGAEDGDFSGVFARRFDTLGNPLGPEFPVNSYTTGDQFFPSVAMDPAGDFVVAWYSAPVGSRGIFARRFDADGVAQGPEFRVNTDASGDYFQRAPGLAIDAGGRFTVVWSNFSYGADPFGAVVGQRFDAVGGRLGPEFLVNTYTTNIQDAPAAASDPAGNVVVAWNSEYQDGGSDGSFGQRFDAAGNRMGPEFPVNTSTTGYQVQPSVGVGADGSFLVAFTHWTGEAPPFELDIRARRFSASGVPEGPDFQVNTYTPGYQSHPLVAATAAGGFVVVWGNGNDGSGSGVFARADCAMRFRALTPCRLADTRQPPGQALAANSSRSFAVSGSCGIPADAGAVALNATAVNPTDLGNLRLHPAGESAPLASSLNFIAGRTRANNATVALGVGGQVTVQCDMPAGSTGSTHLVLDVFGYYAR